MAHPEQPSLFTIHEAVDKTANFLRNELRMRNNANYMASSFLDLAIIF